MFEAVGIGDLHLTDDAGKGGLAKYIEAPDMYVVSEVERVLKWARKRNIFTCFLYGDLCENPRMSYEGNKALAHLFRKNKDIEFVIYLGNHDCKAKVKAEGHSLELLMLMKFKNVKVIEEDTVLEFGKQKIKVCPWPSTAFDPKMLNFGHIEVNGSKLDSGRKIEDGELSKSKAIVCMGHLHTNHQIRNTYYSGTLYQTNFGESLPKFFHHIQYTSISDYEITSVPFDPQYKLFNCVVEDEADVKALPRDPKHLIKLVVKDGADVVVPALPNIVVNKTYKTKHDLTAILTEDLMHGQELILNSADFFKDWLRQQTVKQSLKVKAAKLRKRILGAS